MFSKNKLIQQTVLLLAVISVTDLFAENSKAYINGSIHTFDENLTVADSILVKDGIIQMVGSQDDVLDNTDESTEIINLQGRMMMPPFMMLMLIPFGMAWIFYNALFLTYSVSMRFKKGLGTAWKKTMLKPRAGLLAQD